MPLSSILDGMPSYRPYSNIQPFTVRDGATYLLQFEALKDWWRDVVVPHIDSETTELTEEWRELTTKLLLDWETKMGELTILVSNAVDGINNKVELAEAAKAAAEVARDLAAQYASQAEEIQDIAIKTILTDVASEFRTSLDTLYAPLSLAGDLAQVNTEIAEINEIFANGRLSPESIVNAIKGTQSFQGEDGKQYTLVAGAVRRTNGAWGFIDDSAHGPINGVSVSDFSDYVMQINFADTGATKIATLIIGDDETFAIRGINVGASVGLLDAKVNFTREVNHTVRIGISAGVPSITGTPEITLSNIQPTSFQLNFPSMILSTLGETYPGVNFSKLGRDLTRQLFMSSVNSAYAVFGFHDTAGALVNLEALPTNANHGVLTISGKKLLKNSEMEIASSNFWFIGILEL